MMDRIRICLEADEEVQAAAEKHKDYICGETLAEAIEPAADLKKVDINGHKTGIAIEKV